MDLSGYYTGDDFREFYAGQDASNIDDFFTETGEFLMDRLPELTEREALAQIRFCDSCAARSTLWPFELCLFEPVPSRFRAESSVYFSFFMGLVGFVYFLFSIRFWRPERYCCDDH